MPRVHPMLQVVVLAAAVAPAAQTPPRAAIDAALSAVYPSLVRISVVTASYANGREIRAEASGSGTIVSADGYVVTNHHVAGHARRIVCTLASQEEMPADLVGTDPLSDIAVLKLRPAGARTFQAARFGDSRSVARGDTVLALGSPFALSQSVTLGIVSNPGMVMPRMITAGVSLDGEDVGSIVRWVGHDAAIYPGNSGGPLVNLRGEVIGVNELSVGLAAAIPADVVKPVVEALIANGKVRRGSIGVDLQPRLTTEPGTGALVAWVEDGSPAAAAGVQSGDLLTRIDSTAVDVKFPEQLPLANQVIAALVPGTRVALDIVRAGTVKHVTLTPIERTPANATPIELREWGMVAADLTPASARDLGRTATTGVRVSSVRAGGAVQQAKPPLEPDDVIVDVDGKPVRAIADLKGVTEAALGADGRATVLVSVERREERRLTLVDLSRAHQEDPPREVRKAWLPISFQVLTPQLAQRLGVPGRTGIRVTRIRESWVPLRVGDLVFAVEGTPVGATAPGDESMFTGMLRQYGPGSGVTLTVHRDGTDLPVTVIVRPAPRQPREMPRYDNPEFGFRARAIADADLEDPRLNGLVSGLVVDAVEPGGWAALARLGTGDVIVAVDGSPVGDVGALVAALKASAAARQPSVVFRVRRGVRTVFIEIEPAWEKK